MKIICVNMVGFFRFCFHTKTAKYLGAFVNENCLWFKIKTFLVDIDKTKFKFEIEIEITIQKLSVVFVLANN